MKTAEISGASDVADKNAELEKYLLKKLLRDFFDNAGFKSLDNNENRYYEANKTVDNSMASNKYSRYSKSFEKNTDNIDMLYEYLKYKSGDLSVEAHPDPAQQSACSVIF